MAKRRTWTIWPLALLAGATVLLAACDEDQPPLTEEQQLTLSQEIYLEVADQRISLPLIAIKSFLTEDSVIRHGGISRPSEEYLKSSSRERPVDLEFVEVEVSYYGSYGEDSRSRAMCPLFKKAWERTVCSNYHSPVLVALESVDFHLVDIRKIDRLKQLGRLDCADGPPLDIQGLPREGQPHVLCDIEQPRGDLTGWRAAVRLKGNLAAVWWVSAKARDGEAGERRLQRQAEAIFALATYALGEHEDFETLRSHMCRLPTPRPKQPNSAREAFERECPPKPPHLP